MENLLNTESYASCTWSLTKVKSFAVKGFALCGCVWQYEGAWHAWSTRNNCVSWTHWSWLSGIEFECDRVGRVPCVWLWQSRVLDVLFLLLPPLLSRCTRNVPIVSVGASDPLSIPRSAKHSLADPRPPPLRSLPHSSAPPSIVPEHRTASSSSTGKQKRQPLLCHTHTIPPQPLGALSCPTRNACRPSPFTTLRFSTILRFQLQQRTHARL